VEIASDRMIIVNGSSLLLKKHWGQCLLADTPKECQQTDVSAMGKEYIEPSSNLTLAVSAKPNN
jgi:hypothetical protein